MRREVRELLPPVARRWLRPLARRVGLAPAPGAWDALVERIGVQPFGPDNSDPRACNICQWSGEDFQGPFHCEMADCPRCGSVARDRFLMLCFLRRTPYSAGLRVLETSPRLGAPYRRSMQRSFEYTASDFDLSAHEGDIRIDLQSIDLPDSSIDILLTPHVLEHVPDTDAALREIHRVLSPAGRMYLQIPLCQGTTGKPATPEFHADNTPVFFNFGWDLTDRIRAVGFEVRVLVTEEYCDLLANRESRPSPTSDGFDLPSLWSDVHTRDLDVIADRNVSLRLGFLPAHQFATWECVKSA